jgi:hypothetical protein
MTFVNLLILEKAENNRCHLNDKNLEKEIAGTFGKKSGSFYPAV